jgi:indole-3-glycerol phosphate synthase
MGRLAQVAHVLPAGATVVAESGISTRADVVAAAAAGADAVLVGESLVRSDNPAAMVADLLGQPATDRAGAPLAHRPFE